MCALLQCSSYCCSLFELGLPKPLLCEITHIVIGYCDVSLMNNDVVMPYQMNLKGMSSLRFEASNLTHWGRMTHICVNELTIIGLDNGLSPGRRQAIIWNNAGLLLIEPLGTNLNRHSNIFIHENALEHVVCEMASTLSRSQCVNDVLNHGRAVTDKGAAAWSTDWTVDLRREPKHCIIVRFCSV